MMKSKGVPNQRLKKRRRRVEPWIKHATKRYRFIVEHSVTEGCDKLTRKKRLTNKLWRAFYKCMDIADGKKQLTNKAWSACIFSII